MLISVSIPKRILHVKCTYHRYIRANTCNTCKNMTPFEQGVFGQSWTYWHLLARIMEGFFNIFICSSTYKCKNTAQIHSHHICMYFDGSSCSFQRLLVCCTRGHKVYIRNSMYYYECLRTNTDYVLVSIYSIICTYMFAYVSLREYTNVGHTTFIYV